MSYEKKAKVLIEAYLQITQNYDKARKCAILFCDLNLKELEQEPFVNSLTKLKIHEMKKLKSHI